MTETSGRITLVIGGAKSGKSLYALNRASAYPGAKAYVATAQAFDAEMEERIKKHKMERGDGWHTFEEPLGIAETLKEITETHDVIVIDCLTLWLSNLLLGDADREKEIESFLSSLVVRHSSQVFIVSNEVGGGLVKNQMLMQIYADVTGREIAEAASPQVGALGAALLAVLAADEGQGGYGSLTDAAARMVPSPSRVYQPNAQNKDVYDQLYKEYIRLSHYFSAENNVMKTLRRMRGAQ